MFNSIFVAAATILLGLIINGFPGSAFPVLRFPGRNIVFIMVLTFWIHSRRLRFALHRRPVHRAAGHLSRLDWSGRGKRNSHILFRQFFAQLPRELTE